MVRINGLFGHIKHNDLMSILMFAGFALAFQLMAVTILFVPLMFLDSAHSVISLDGYVGRYVPMVLVASAVVFGVKFSAHVETVRNQLNFQYLARHDDARLFNIVETLALTAGIRTPKIGMIESPARNAFACGLGQQDAVIVITRGLRQALTDDELEAVFAHEITHVVNNDIRLIAAANVMMGSLTAISRKNPFILKGWLRWVFIPIFPIILIVSGGLQWLAQFSLKLGMVSRLVIASSREYIADAEAIRLTHKPEALISALRRIENLSTIDGLAPENDAMMIDGASMGEFATHPTIFERIAAIEVLSGARPKSTNRYEMARTPAPVRSNLALGRLSKPKPQQDDDAFWADTYNAPSNAELASQQSLFARISHKTASPTKKSAKSRFAPIIGLCVLFGIIVAINKLGDVFSERYTGSTTSTATNLLAGDPQQGGLPSIKREMNTGFRGPSETSDLRARAPQQEADIASYGLRGRLDSDVP